MKYIRTKDGIFDKIDETLVLASKPPKYDLCKNGEHIKYEFCHNCKLANTIEELCDEFVAIHKTFSKTYCIRKVPFEKQNENFNIYGAIWTDKGLIYVAKMNDKGELELL